MKLKYFFIVNHKNIIKKKNICVMNCLTIKRQKIQKRTSRILKYFYCVDLNGLLLFSDKNLNKFNTITIICNNNY